MECCIYVEDSGGRSELVQEKMVRARKEHCCCECSNNIKKGEIYEKVTGKFDECFRTFKTCSVCAEIRRKLFCDRYIYGDMKEDILRQDGCLCPSVSSLSDKAKLKLEIFLEV